MSGDFKCFLGGWLLSGGGQCVTLVVSQPVGHSLSEA